jgi:2,4-dienoyl-CoA reductase (NADPH2)
LAQIAENLPKNKKVLIIGGGLIGVDIATALISLNNTVIIVKRTTDFGGDMEMIAKNLSLKMIEGRTVYAERNGETIRFDDIDIIVISASMRSYCPLEQDLTGQMPVYLIGDAKKVGNAQDAIRDGYETAKSL